MAKSRKEARKERKQQQEDAANEKVTTAEGSSTSITGAEVQKATETASNKRPDELISAAAPSARGGSIRSKSRSSEFDSDREETRGTSGEGMFEFIDCNELKKGSIVLLKDSKVCKILEKNVSKTGKHGGAKAHLVATDMFTGKKVEEIYSTQDKVKVPSVTRIEYKVTRVDSEEGKVFAVPIDAPAAAAEELKLPTHLPDVAERIERLNNRAVVTALNVMGKKVITLCREV